MASVLRICGIVITICVLFMFAFTDVETQIMPTVMMSFVSQQRGSHATGRTPPILTKPQIAPYASSLINAPSHPKAAKPKAKASAPTSFVAAPISDMPDGANGTTLLTRHRTARCPHVPKNVTRLSKCRLPQYRIIFVGHNHKTGTALSHAVFAKIQKKIRNVTSYHPEKNIEIIDHKRGGFERAVRLANCSNTSTKVIFFKMFDPPNSSSMHSQIESIQSRCWNFKIHVILMVRKHIDIVLSAYFYHMYSKEWWLHVPATMAGNKTDKNGWFSWRKFGNDCKKPKCGVPQSACSAFFPLVESSAMTYQQILLKLPPDVGVLVEAAESASELHAIGNWKSAIWQEPSYRGFDFAAVDLDDDVSRDFNGTWCRIFNFIGVTDDHLPGCVRTASKHDLKLHPPSRYYHVHDPAHETLKTELKFQLETSSYIKALQAKVC